MSAEQLHLVILGAGRMGQAVLSGLVASGWDRALLTAVEAHGPTAQAVRERLGIEVAPADVALPRADVVVVAVKPQDVTRVLTEVSPYLPAGAPVVSLAAGLTTATLVAHLPVGTPVVRVMPNTPALVRQGMSVMSPAPGCPPRALLIARRVLSAVGEVREAPESVQDAVTAVSGSGPAYVFHVAEAMIDAGVQLGLPRPLARDLTVQTLIGAATMLRDSGEHPAVLRENVTSPGGTTAAALHVLEELAVKAAFAKAMRASRDRSAELADS
jgi:pyrroline-5-carboxylate reductase